MTVLDLEKKALERWYNGDPWGFADLSDSGITVVNPAVVKPISGLDEYRAYLQPFEGIFQQQAVEISHPLIQMHGDAAVLSYHDHTVGEGNSPSGWNVTSVYFRSGGTWRLVHNHRAYLHHRLPDSVEVPLPFTFPPPVYEGVLAELMALETAAMVRWRTGDPWGFIELYDTTTTYFDTGTPQRLDGLEALQAEYATRAGKIFYDVNDFIAPQVQVCGDTAVLFYRFFSTSLHPDGSIANRTPWNCTEVYTRINGQWKIIHNHWSFIQGRAIRE